MRPFYLYNGTPYTGETASLYWDARRNLWIDKYITYFYKDKASNICVLMETKKGAGGWADADDYISNSSRKAQGIMEERQLFSLRFSDECCVFKNN